MLGFGQSILLLADHAQPTQCIGIIGLGFQARGKCLFGCGMIISLQRLQPTRYQWILLPATGWLLTPLVELITNVLIIGMGLEERLEQRHLRRRRRAYPDQRHAPALIGIPGDVRVRTQPRQRSDPLGPGVFATGQMLGKKQRQNRVVRVLPHQAFEALACFGPVRAAETQVGVVLAPDLAFGQTAVEQLAKDPGRLVALTGIGQTPGLIQQGLILRLAEGNVLLQLHRLPRHW